MGMGSSGGAVSRWPVEASTAALARALGACPNLLRRAAAAHRRPALWRRHEPREPAAPDRSRAPGRAGRGGDRIEVASRRPRARRAPRHPRPRHPAARLRGRRSLQRRAACRARPPRGRPRAAARLPVALPNARALDRPCDQRASGAHPRLLGPGLLRPPRTRGRARGRREADRCDGPLRRRRVRPRPDHPPGSRPGAGRRHAGYAGRARPGGGAAAGPRGGAPVRRGPPRDRRAQGADQARMSPIRRWLRAAIGELRWTQPGWLLSLRTETGRLHRESPERLYGGIALALLLVGGGFEGWRWWKSRPRPDYVAV